MDSARAWGPHHITLSLLALVVGGVFLGIWPGYGDAFRSKWHVLAIGSCALFLWLLYLRRGAFQWPDKWTSAGLGLWLTGMALSLPHAGADMRPVLFFLAYLPLFLLFLVVFDDACREGFLVEALRIFIIVAALIQSLIVMGQFLLESPWPHFAAYGKMRHYGTLGNPGWVAILLVVSLPCLFAVEAGSKKISIRQGVAVGIVLAGLLVLHSREAFVAVGSMWFVMVCGRKIGPQWPLIASILLTVVLFVVIAAKADWVDLHTLWGRLLIQRVGLDMLRDHWFSGVGLLRIEAEYTAYQATLFAQPSWAAYAGNAAVVQELHNEFLQWGVTCSVFAMIAVFGLFILGLYRSLCCIGRKDFYWGVALLGLLMMCLGAGLQLQAPLSLLLMVVLARATASTGEGIVVARGHGAAGVLAAVLLLWSVVWADRDIRSNAYEGRGDRAMEDKDSWRAGHYYKEALHASDANPELHKKYATALFLEGRFQEAKSSAQRAELLSRTPENQLLLGRILVAAGDYDEAENVYRRIIQAYPLSITPRFIMAQLHLQQGRLYEARQQLMYVVDGDLPSHNREMSREKISEQRKEAKNLLRAINDRIGPE